MILVILYGPPAVGKLTIGKALAEATGFKLFHNHLTYDLVRELFDAESLAFWPTVHRLRLDLFEAAAKHQLPGVITTFVYDKEGDEAFLQEVIDRIERHGGRVLLVQLSCEPTVRRQRVTNDDRKQYHKLQEFAQYDHFVATHSLDAAVPFEPNFVVDTAHTPPAEAARLIQQHYQLPTASLPEK